MKRNDILSLRKSYKLYENESMGANAVLNLCDEVESLRIALRAMLMSTPSYAACDEQLRAAHDLAFEALGD